MIFGILTLITALSISAVAIYYSVAGLVAIFAAAAMPIMIMGGTLEVAKLVTAVWLHKHWKQATWWLKTYLSTAVIVLMLITSMGIFGFLSKAHIEQTAQSTDNLARIETLQNEIDRNLGIVGRAENRIRVLESTGTGSDTNIQNQIDKEQERIDKAFERIQPAIEEQNAIIAGVTKLFQDELDKIDADIETLQGYIDNGEVKKAQQMIGASADGVFGKKTADKIGEWQKAKQAERSEWLTKIQDAANSPTVKAARDEIQRLRKSAEDQVANSQALIERLRTQLANSDNADEIQKSIDEQNDRIRTASNEVDRLTEEKIQLESDYRKLEAEVGPIKYIAEFIYGEQADNNMLEEAVRWVIITIIFVFDPLAVLLLIASQYTFEWRRSKDDSGGWLRQYEQARAQRIVDNPGYNIDDPKEDTDENSREEDSKEESENAEELRDGQEQESVPSETGDDPVVVEEQEGEGAVVDSKKKDESSSDELKQARVKEVEEQEQDTDWVTAKQLWKDSNPTLSLKFFKDLYIEGKINNLPWSDLVPKKTYVMKDKDKQVTLETEESPLSQQETKQGYIQNEEQKQNSSIWKRIRRSENE
jgi:hypothetical protein